MIWIASESLVRAQDDDCDLVWWYDNQFISLYGPVNTKPKRQFKLPLNWILA